MKVTYEKGKGIVPNRNRALEAIKRVSSRVKNKGVDVASDILSAPKRKYYESKSRGADKKYQTYKMANDAKGVADKGNESDPLFRARAEMRLAQRKALQKKK